MKAAGHADREWYLAVNDATGYGEAATLITGILLMPTTLVVSFIPVSYTHLIHGRGKRLCMTKHACKQRD